MKGLAHEIAELFTTAIQKAFPELSSDQNFAEVTIATTPAFGHYQCNSCLRLSKVLKRSPRSVAEAVLDNLQEKESWFSKVEIAGPGFINLTLHATLIAKRANEMVRSPHLGIDPPMSRERVLVDFSAPNVAKEMHVGHLRSTIIGDAIARLFEFLGHQVLRINHIGDWGTAFGMLIAYLQQHHPEITQSDARYDLSDLMRWYRASKGCFEEDAAFKARALRAVVLLQGGDPDCLELWKKIVAISQSAFHEIYRLLDVRIEDRGESFYNPLLAEVVADLERAHISTLSEGAKCVFIEGIDIPLMVQKSDGGYNYDTTDLAAMKYRVAEDRADRIIIVTDAGQALHFKLVYEAAIKAHYLDPKRVRFDHVPFGVVLGPDGKRFRTRSGEVERLSDLISAAIEKARAILKERDASLPEDELNALAHILGIDALKYADLSSNRIRDYLFSYERMLRFEGNTATFLLYSYVRINGIKRKVGISDMTALIAKESISLTHPSEVDLALHLLGFPEVLYTAADELYLHTIADYLFNLAQKFNVFFRDCRVEGSDEQQSRLLLAELTARVLKTGLEILGLRVVERM